ncbi:MAG: IS3 family transposase, partial [Thermoplasmata archaeon]|nr:IS3 family transposase [Candidatus Sysuiplasma acidicola]
MEAFRAMISDGDLSVSSAASMLHTSGSTFQYVKRAPCRRLKADEIEKRKLIEEFAGDNITYGYRRIWALVRRQDVFISRKRVRRMLKEMNLQREAHFPRPRLPQTGNLVSGVPDVRWYTDITYIETTDYGNCAFIEIEDSCTRDIRAWDFLVSCGAS